MAIGQTNSSQKTDLTSITNRISSLEQLIPQQISVTFTFSDNRSGTTQLNYTLDLIVRGNVTHVSMSNQSPTTKTITMYQSDIIGFYGRFSSFTLNGETVLYIDGSDQGSRMINFNLPINHKKVFFTISNTGTSVTTSS